MFVKILLDYILGYVSIKVEGLFIERFINICISKKILLWNTKRRKGTIFYANVSVQEYRKLKEIAKKTKSRINIESKKGLPFILHKYRKRKLFIGLLCLIAVGLMISSNFIWNIEIKGEESISEEEIVQTLEKYGLKTGTRKQKVDSSYVINNIRLERDDIAWIGINIKGTNAIIEIKETTKVPEIIKEDEYCNIISDKTGIITKISVQNGTANVQIGDIVKQGDTLISGIIEAKYTEARQVHSLGEIEARVWYTKKEKVFLNQKIPTETGDTEKKYSIILGELKINLTKPLSKFKNYDTMNENKKLMLFSNFYLPIEIVKITNKEYEYVDVTYTEEEIVAITVEKIEEELKNEIKNEENIVNKQINTYGGNGCVEVEVIYEVLEHIGQKQKI